MTKHGVQEVSYSNHQAAVAHLVNAIPKHLEYFLEVKLDSNLIDERAMRVDVLIFDKLNGFIVGFEVKTGFYRMSEYATAIKQASDYRHGLIRDDRLANLNGRRLNAAFVFPRWGGGHDEPAEYAREAKGMEILAHHLRVGFAKVLENGLVTYANGMIALRDGAWTVKGHELFNAKDQVGSLKTRDISKGI